MAEDQQAIFLDESTPKSVDEHCFSSHDQPYRSRVFELEKRIDMLLKLSQIKDVHKKLSTMENRRRLMKTTSTPNLHLQPVGSSSNSSTLYNPKSGNGTSATATNGKTLLEHACLEFIPRLVEQQEYMMSVISSLEKTVKHLHVKQLDVQQRIPPNVNTQLPLVPQPPDNSIQKPVHHHRKQTSVNIVTAQTPSNYLAETTFSRLFSVERIREINQQIRRKHAIPFQKSLHPL